jgi:hypothetical protein
MNAQTAPRTLGFLRRTALASAVAGIAALGMVGSAPVALAAAGHGGPDAFVQLDHGREPVFFCEADKAEKQHNNCLDVTRDRF